MSTQSVKGVSPRRPLCNQRSIIDPQKKKVMNGQIEGTRRLRPAHTASMSAANAPWAMPTVNGETSRTPRANTSSGSVPKPASMKQLAPMANRTQPAK